jgi:branched-subunit amino acid aminotransferase/4-amino-4-deoxychorismate lyase
VAEVDNRPIGRGTTAGKPGPITLKLQKEYDALVRGELQLEYSRNWFTALS